MLVRATRTGLYDNELRHEGDEFEIEEGKFGLTWMEPIDEEAKVESRKRVDSDRKKEVAKLESEIATLQERLKRLGGRKKPRPEVEVL